MEQMNLFLNEPSISTVSEVTSHIRNLVEGDSLLQDVWVKGEVSNLSIPKSGHMYFTIKDEGSALKCIMWRNAVMRSAYQPQNGDLIEVHGGVGIYEQGGQYQLYADKLRPAGEGLLFQRFLLLKAKLEEEGLFDPLRKQEIPSIPKKIGIVTSPTSAALQDMLDTIKRRYPIVEVVLAPTSVQGDAASDEIVSAIKMLNKLNSVDVILIARGGGSIEDLWSFNTEEVVRAIADSEKPTICGVGHETDFTLSDMAADLRAPTPTAAAELATPDKIEILYSIDLMRNDLRQSLQEKIQDQEFQLQSLKSNLDYLSPEKLIFQDAQAIDDIETRLDRTILHQFELLRSKFSGVESQLKALDPLAVLERGYAVVTDDKGDVVKSVGDISNDQSILVNVRDGKFGAVVNNGDDNE